MQKRQTGKSETKKAIPLLRFPLLKKTTTKTKQTIARFTHLAEISFVSKNVKQYVFPFLKFYRAQLVNLFEVTDNDSSITYSPKKSLKYKVNIPQRCR